jgi:hypothetical protein
MGTHVIDMGTLGDPCHWGNPGAPCGNPVRNPQEGPQVAPRPQTHLTSLETQNICCWGTKADTSNANACKTNRHPQLSAQTSTMAKARHTHTHTHTQTQTGTDTDRHTHTQTFCCFWGEPATNAPARGTTTKTGVKVHHSHREEWNSPTGPYHRPRGHSPKANMTAPLTHPSREGAKRGTGRKHGACERGVFGEHRGQPVASGPSQRTEPRTTSVQAGTPTECR